MLIIDVARLVIFPSVMAFAASSDLFTMTISNRISLILGAGFLALAVGTGFVLSAAAAYFISRRLGLFEPPVMAPHA